MHFTGIDRDQSGNQYLIIDRNPGKIAGKEICQDFRFFYDLRPNKEASKYVLKDFDTKSEVVVVVVEPNSVKIRFKELHQFLKSKKLYLLLRYSCSEYSKHSLAELGLRENEVKSDETELPDGHLCWRYAYRATNVDGYQTECLLEARRLIGYAEVPKNKSGFIIGIDEYGNEIRLDPRELNEAVYQNQGWSTDRMFVHFNKKILDKYYSDHHTYTVEDTFLICHDSEGKDKWILLIDDDHEDKVCVELSRFLLIPDDETDYWHIYNIPPNGSVSNTYFKRYEQGHRVSSTRPEHLFRECYNKLQAVCEKYLGWQLVRSIGTRNPLVQYNISGIPSTVQYSGPDEHHLRCLRVPSSDNEMVFEGLVLSLTKVLIDSLNENDFKKLISDTKQAELEQKKADPKKSDPRGIDYLEAALDSCQVKNIKNHISFLRKLQRLRSTGSAHLKGKNYQKSAKSFNLDTLGLRQGFTEILRQAVDCLEFLIRVVQSGELIGKRKLPVLYNLNEQLHALLKELFPSGTERVFATAKWVEELDLETTRIADDLRTEVIDKFNSSPLEFRGLCEKQITSMNPDSTPSGIRHMLTDIAKVFISDAGSNLPNGINLLSDAQRVNMQLTEFFEHVAGKAAYCKKLVEYSGVLIKLDEVKNCDWYPYYVAWYLSYASAYTLYAYEHVWHAEGLDSVPIILDAVSAVEGAADAAERIVNVDAVRETAKALTQITKYESD